MDARSGIDNGKPRARKRKFDLFRPVSVKSDGRRLESANWCIRFQHKGKRTCRSLGTADYRLALQRARCLVKAVRADGWASATVLPTSHGSLTISDFLEQYHRSAVSRGLRPRSIAAIEKEFRRISAQVGARRLADLTPVALQQWVESCRLKPDLRGPSSRTNVLAPPRLWKPGTGGRQARKEARSFLGPERIFQNFS